MTRSVTLTDQDHNTAEPSLHLAILFEHSLIPVFYNPVPELNAPMGENSTPERSTYDETPSPCSTVLRILATPRGLVRARPFRSAGLGPSPSEKKNEHRTADQVLNRAPRRSL